MSLIEFKNVCFTYPGRKLPALNSVDFSVERGEFILLFGKSGSGKTTLLRHIKPQLAPRGNLSGELMFNGKPLRSLDERESVADIGFVAQNTHMQAVSDNVWHELAFGLENLGVDSALIRLRVCELASFFGLDKCFNSPLSALSGGQRQLVNLAAVLITRPSVLVLDEPTAQLDPIASIEFMNMLKRVNSELGTTIVLSEHRLENALPACTRSVLLSNGTIKHDAAPRLLLSGINKLDSGALASLPACAGIFAGVSRFLPENKRDECPLTVRECSDMLGKLIPSEATASNAHPVSEKAAKNKSTPFIEARSIWYGYPNGGADVLHGLSFEARAGEISCIVGSSGAGKSTALLALCGIISPYRGRILVEGKPLKGEQDRGVRLLPQSPEALFSNDTCYGELRSLCCENTRITDMLQRFELNFNMDSHPYDISRGEQQRLALAKLLLTEPRCILLDEPTQGMDGEFRALFGNMLRELAKNGICVIMASHDIEFCAEYADICALCFDGEIITQGTPKTLFGGNSFYTTEANRAARRFFPNAIRVGEVVELCKKAQKPKT